MDLNIITFELLSISFNVKYCDCPTRWEKTPPHTLSNINDLSLNANEIANKKSLHLTC